MFSCPLCLLDFFFFLFFPPPSSYVVTRVEGEFSAQLALIQRVQLLGLVLRHDVRR